MESTQLRRSVLRIQQGAEHEAGDHNTEDEHAVQLHKDEITADKFKKVIKEYSAKNEI
jgi:hypothetical protein